MGSNDVSKPFIEKFDYEKLGLEDPVDDNVSQTSKVIVRPLEDPRLIQR
jgi:hypothetical protein